MKKLFILTSLVALALTGCGSNTSSQKTQTNPGDSAIDDPRFVFERNSLSIITPTGAPALAFYDFATSPNFETNDTPTNIVAMMVAGQKDVVVLPTNAGIQAINGKSAPYKLAATITFGNFYVVSMGNDTNNVMDASDTILLFQKNNVPDKIFHYVYGNSLDSAIHYVEAVSDASRAVISGSFVDADTGTNMTPNYVMIAEPALTNVKSKKDGLTVYANLQEEYKNKANNKEIFQASVFVKNTLDTNTANAFLSTLEYDITSALNDSNKLKEGMSKVESAATVFGIAPEMAETVLKNGNGMGLGYKYAKSNKAAIDTFLSLFNIPETNEEIYY